MKSLKGLMLAMKIDNLTDKEIALELARRLRAWRVDPRGAGLTQAELARRGGVGITPLKRFEKTGGIGLNNLIGMLRALGLLDRLETLVPEPSAPGRSEERRVGKECRSLCDWSSDVCSSDLRKDGRHRPQQSDRHAARFGTSGSSRDVGAGAFGTGEIGRASCRERV